MKTKSDLGQEIQEDRYTKLVHNDGFVRLVEWMGDDFAPTRAARISYKRESKGKDQDLKLLGSLIERGHHSVFEMIQLKLHVRAPIFVLRQWMRHRIGSFNEISARYTTVRESYWLPEFGRMQIPGEKQASERADWLDFRDKMGPEFAKKYPDPGSWDEEIAATMNRCNMNAFEEYHRLIDMGVSREMARTVLPVAQYSEMYWSVNMRTMINFLQLRSSKSAQKEIRDYARAIRTILESTHPQVMNAVRNLID